MLKEEVYTGLVSAINVPIKIDDDGFIYFLINLIDVVPPPAEIPYVLYIDTSKPQAAAMMLLMASAYVTKTRITVGLEPKRQGRVEWATIGDRQR